MKRGLYTLSAAAVVAVALVSASSAASPSYCSSSGDVCIGILKTKAGAVLFQITTAAHYFNRYRLCVRGPASRVCKTFPVRPAAGGTYASTVNWRRNFPNQGPGLYRVTWNAAAKTLTFRR